MAISKKTATKQSVAKKAAARPAPEKETTKPTAKKVPKFKPGKV
jgi:hypothetical protein